MKAILISFVLAFFIFCSSVRHTTAYSITLEAGDEQCFMISLAVKQACSGSYEVITEDAESIRVTVKGPDNDVHYDTSGETPKKGESENDQQDDNMGDAFQFDADKEGIYTMCFSNDEQLSDGLSRIIAFNFRASDNGDAAQISGLESELQALRRGLEELRDHHAYMNQREDVHQTTLESINFKVLCWTIAESIILIATAIWQISYINSFFETKRRL